MSLFEETGGNNLPPQGFSSATLPRPRPPCGGSGLGTTNLCARMVGNGARCLCLLTEVESTQQHKHNAAHCRHTNAASDAPLVQAVHFFAGMRFLVAVRVFVRFASFSVGFVFFFGGFVFFFFVRDFGLLFRWLLFTRLVSLPYPGAAGIHSPLPASFTAHRPTRARLSS